MPNLHAQWKRDDNGRLTTCEVYGSPIAVIDGKGVHSSLVVERYMTDEIKIVATQVIDGSGTPEHQAYLKTIWKPGEIHIQKPAIRALRDTLTRMLDQMDDEHECG